MSDHFSPFPSCFRPTTNDHPHPPPPSAGEATISGNPNLTTYLYDTNHGLVALTWSRSVLGRSLHLYLHPDGGDVKNSPSLPPPLSTPSFQLHIKPLIFWNKHGSKRLNPNVQIFWDLTRAKFKSGFGPEPQSGFYIAVVINGEMTLLVGDSAKEAYSKTKSEKPKRPQALLLRREHVFGNRVYTTKARFGGKNREITIECCSNVINDDHRLCIGVDGKRVLQIKHLKWKFRGNERIEVDGVPIQISWDVYNWLFDEHSTDGHAVFMFRFENLGFDDEEYQGSRSNVQDDKKNGVELCGFGMSGIERKKMKKSMVSTRSSSSSSMSSASSSGGSSSVMEWASMEEKELEGTNTGFSLLVYAWKT